MKKLIFLFLLPVIIYAQDLVVFPKAYYYHDTLNAVIDTVDIGFSDDIGRPIRTISAATTTGTDTLEVYSRTLDDRFWVRQSLYDISGTMDTTITEIIVTTEPKEYLVNGYEHWNIRLIMRNRNTGILFTIAAKKP